MANFLLTMTLTEKNETEEVVQLLKLFRNKRGSEIIQVLIVIAIMGAVAVSSIIGISGKIKEKNAEVITSIETNIDKAVAETS